MIRPLLLDLYCGAGGASVGYHRAGFDVVGVDIRPQPRYTQFIGEQLIAALCDDVQGRECGPGPQLYPSARPEGEPS